MTPRPHGSEDPMAALKGLDEVITTVTDLKARVEELEAALREVLWRRGDPSVVRQVARRALRGSVSAGEETDV